MRKLIAGTATALLAGTAFTLGAGTASASFSPDADACVTKAEFAQVHTGMTRAQVARIFDTDGTLVVHLVLAHHIYTQRSYRPCVPASSVYVSYRDSIVSSKTAHWGN